MVKLRNQWVPVDPRSWRVNMDVVPNVALGGGTNAEKVQLLSLMLAKQEMIISTVGPDNPLVTPKQYFNTLAKLIETGGFKDPSLFFTDPESPQAQEKMAAQGQEPPPPDPKVEEAKARIELEAAKMQAQAQRDEQKAAGDLQLAREKHALEMQQRREEQAADLAFKRELANAELNLKREEMQMEFALKSEANRMNAAQSYSINGPDQGGIAG
jgi:hypothetical protein